MNSFPIVAQYRPDPPAELRQAVSRLAQDLRNERPELTVPDQFRNLVPHALEDGPTLHLDDLSSIPRLDAGRDIRFYQDRARLRAGDGDVVASCSPPIEGQEAYCRERLGLGAPDWLRPQPPKVPARIAEACWEDRAVRRTLVRKLRTGELAYLHPNMGTLPVWELAYLLTRSSHRPLHVIAPPPAVTDFANDKPAFASVVERLFGRSFVPRTKTAWNLATIAQRVQDLAEVCQVIGIKLPNSAGGDGNLVLNAATFRDQPLKDVRQTLQQLLPHLGWDGACALLLDCWETDVTCSPSAQVWIPPEAEGPPQVEGLFVQTVEGDEGVFVGSAPARLPREIEEEIVDRCWLLALLYQHLGYIGRCSFDIILLNERAKSPRIEFIECNGRWGGTSVPMTLLNRLFGDWSKLPCAMRVLEVPGLDGVEFTELLTVLGDELFDLRSGRGTYILYNAGRLQARSGVSAIALADTWDEASHLVNRVLPDHLQGIVSARTIRSRDPM